MKPGRLSETFVLIVSLFMLTPIVSVIIMAFSEAGTFTVSLHGLSLTWFRAFFNSKVFTDGFMLSLWLGLATSIIATTLGCLASVAIGRMGSRLARLCETLMVTPILVPHILFGAALLLFFLNSSYKGTRTAAPWACDYRTAIFCPDNSGGNVRHESDIARGCHKPWSRSVSSFPESDLSAVAVELAICSYLCVRYFL